MPVRTPVRSLAERIRLARLYAVTMPPAGAGSYGAMVELALKGGADVVQLRDKTLPAPDLAAVAKGLRELCGRYGALFIVNDDVRAALESGADGVHLGQDDLPIAEARRLAGRREFLIGRSTHGLEQALRAEKEGADYLGCGPVFSTPTKPGAAALGLELVRRYRESVRIPFVAIGGIDGTNIGRVAEAGASCAAAARAIFAAADPEEAARTLKEIMNRRETK